MGKDILDREYAHPPYGTRMVGLILAYDVEQERKHAESIPLLEKGLIARIKDYFIG